MSTKSENVVKKHPRHLIPCTDNKYTKPIGDKRQFLAEHQIRK